MKRFLLVQIFFGPLVLLSYWHGVATHEALVPALWGDMPAGLQRVYTMNMFLAAAGYLPGVALFALHRPSRTAFGETPDGVLPAYLLVLIPSALWLGLTFAYLEEPSTWLWWVMRVDLFLVALGSVMLFVALLTLAPRRGLLHAAAVLGHLPFMLQTAVLDPFVWPLFIPR